MNLSSSGGPGALAGGGCRYADQLTNRRRRFTARHRLPRQADLRALGGGAREG